MYITYPQAINGTDGAYLIARTDSNTNQLFWERVEHHILPEASLETASGRKYVNLDGSEYQAGEKNGIVSSLGLNEPVKPDKDGKAYYRTKWGIKSLNISYADYIKELNNITKDAVEVTLHNDPTHAKYRF